MKLFPYDRPASAGEVLDAAFLLFRRTLPGCLPWSLLAVLLGNLPSVYLLTTGQSLSLLERKDMIWWGLMAGAAMAGLWVWVFLLLRQYRVACGERPGFFGGALDALRGTPRAIVLILLAMLAMTHGGWEGGAGSVGPTAAGGAKPATKRTMTASININ